MVVPLIKWFHTLFAHPGCKHFRMILQACHYHPVIRQQVDEFHWDFCQCVKIPCKGMGLLPKHDLTNTSWNKVVVDHVGPWSAKTEHINGECYASTCIDTTTNPFKLTCIGTKSSDAIARKFELTWLAWNPRLLHVVHDNGGKFTDYAFTSLLLLLGIKDVTTTSKNLQ